MSVPHAVHGRDPPLLPHPPLGTCVTERPPLRTLPSINFLNLTVSEICPDKILQVKVTTARSKVKSRSCCFQHCTGHITMGSWKGRGNQYIQFVRVLYCKLPTNCKQLPALPLQVMTGIEPWPQRWEVGGESVTTLPPWPHLACH